MGKRAKAAGCKPDYDELKGKSWVGAVRICGAGAGRGRRGPGIRVPIESGIGREANFAAEGQLMEILSQVGRTPGARKLRCRQPPTPCAQDTVSVRGSMRCDTRVGSMRCDTRAFLIATARSNTATDSAQCSGGWLEVPQAAALHNGAPRLQRGHK